MISEDFDGLGGAGSSAAKKLGSEAGSSCAVSLVWRGSSRQPFTCDHASSSLSPRKLAVHKGQAVAGIGSLERPAALGLGDIAVEDFSLVEDPLEEADDRSPNLSDFFFVKLGSSFLLLRSCNENVLANEDGKSEKLRDDGVTGSG